MVNLLKNYVFYLLLFLVIISNSAVFAKEAQPLVKELNSKGTVSIISIKTMINPGSEMFLKRSIKRAEEDKAAALVVYLDTPGGILFSTQNMIKAIFASKVPVIIYIAPSGAAAISAGVFISEAAHVLAMAPGTSLGAAHPVSGEGKDIKGDMRKKVEEITAAMIKSIAEQRGRNVNWVEKAVKESASLTAEDALKEGVIDLIADDLDELLTNIKGKKIKLNGKDVILGDYSANKRISYTMDFREHLLNFLSTPTILSLLFLIGITGLVVEVKNPGLIIPGVVGAICLALAVMITQNIPIVQGGLILLILGVILIALEIAVPSGILGVGGMLSVVLGVIYLVDIDKSPDLTINYSILLPIALVLFIMLSLVFYTAVTMKRKRLTGKESLVGLIGRAVKNINKHSGKVFVEGEYWNAKSQSNILKGEKVKIIGVEQGGVLLVEPQKSP